MRYKYLRMTVRELRSRYIGVEENPLSVDEKQLNKDIEYVLNLLGNRGWELMSHTDPYAYVFKKEYASDPDPEEYPNIYNIQSFQNILDIPSFENDQNIISNHISKRLNVSIQKTPAHSSVDPHYHNIDKIIFVLKGEVTVTYGEHQDRNLLFKTNSLIFIPSGILHSITNNSDDNAISLVISSGHNTMNIYV